MTKRSKERQSDFAAAAGGRQPEAWRSFLGWVDRHADPRWVFGGLGDAGFGLVSGIGRLATGSLGDKKSPRLLEKELLYAFRRRLPQFHGGVGLSDLDMLAIAQKHGLPILMFEWPTNPLVASSFATVSEPGRCNAEMNGATVTVTPDPHSLRCRIVACRVKRAALVEATDNPSTQAGVRIVLPRAHSGRIAKPGWTVQPAFNARGAVGRGT